MRTWAHSLYEPRNDSASSAPTSGGAGRGDGLAGAGEAEHAAGVGLHDHLGLVVWDVGERLGSPLAAVRPVGIRVRVVDLHRDPVDPDRVPVLDPVVVVDEAAVEVLAEQVTRPGLL